MIVRIARITALALIWTLLAGARPASGEGWSLPKLFPESKTERKKVPPKPGKHQPSTLDKMTAGTKRFFTDMGNTLSFKRSEPPKKTTTPYNPWIKPPKHEPSKPSWLTSLFYKEEPKKPKTPSEWLEQERLDP